MNFLLAYLPRQAHLVISSRRELPLALARLRVQGALTEIQAADLRFSPAEVAAFFAATSGQPLPAATVRALHERTEGWVAGLRLAAGGVVLVALTALGIMIALLVLLWRQVGALVTVLSILFELLSGAYLPITAYPPAAQAVAYVLPYTWGYDLIRYYSFDGQWQPLLPVWQEWSILLAFAVVFMLLSRYLLTCAEMQAKRAGLNII